MHIRLTCDLTQEQLDDGFDCTLLTYHTRYVRWLVELDIPIVGFSIYWEVSEDGNNHMFATASLLVGAEDHIDKKFLDEMHLGGREDG